MRHGLVKFSRAEHFDLRIVLVPLLALLHEVLPHLLTLSLSISGLLVANFILLGTLLILHTVQVILSARFFSGALIHLLEDLQLLRIQLILSFLLYRLVVAAQIGLVSEHFLGDCLLVSDPRLETSNSTKLRSGTLPRALHHELLLLLEVLLMEDRSLRP